MKSELFEISGQCLGQPDSLDEQRIKNTAAQLLQCAPVISPELELERLYARADLLEHQIAAALNGERHRYEMMRSDCLKAIAQLSLATMRTV